MLLLQLGIIPSSHPQCSTLNVNNWIFITALTRCPPLCLPKSHRRHTPSALRLISSRFWKLPIENHQNCDFPATVLLSGLVYVISGLSVTVFSFILLSQLFHLQRATFLTALFTHKILSSHAYCKKMTCNCTKRMREREWLEVTD